MRKIIFTFYLITWLSRFKAAPICSSRTGTYLSCGLAAVACDSVYRITEANDMSLLIWPPLALAPLEFRSARSEVAVATATAAIGTERERAERRETRFTAVISIYHLKDPPSDNARVKPQSSRARDDADDRRLRARAEEERIVT